MYCDDPRRRPELMQVHQSVSLCGSPTGGGGIRRPFRPVVADVNHPARQGTHSPRGRLYFGGGSRAHPIRLEAGYQMTVVPKQLSYAAKSARLVEQSLVSDRGGDVIALRPS
jgi:hypothetical protein